MKKTIDEHAERFSEIADSYDDDKTPEYEACASLVIERAAPSATDTVLDVGCGTGAIALALAAEAERVVGRDISDGMLDRAREKADERGLENVEFGYGEFRDPDYDGVANVVVSNFALHHLGEAEKREAIETMAGLDGGGSDARFTAPGPRRIVLGDVMFFGSPDPDEPFYGPGVDDPSTVGSLVEMFTSVGYAVTHVDRVHDQVGVITAERLPDDGRAE
ncbi:class I SAM-dependent methyltransferase [Candidatus Halobonum tyrrellensis]|uniref:Protein-L-isoaspartate O-methyltransferase n=1 Tax=Candidatus Halobonum tyrrellensis G22 TaxID=1324957 RepID=V4HFC4_9EURY|nr:class I SAM-dependent methyltransferase [Candidatus Halobonum tyrrellensis]ESP89380.1 protein-L-isoaspartate O-methyltransferase [Candidatus Halobonum tyrrellensis G22]